MNNAESMPAETYHISLRIARKVLAGVLDRVDVEDKVAGIRGNWVGSDCACTLTPRNIGEQNKKTRRTKEAFLTLAYLSFTNRILWVLILIVWPKEICPNNALSRSPAS